MRLPHSSAETLQWFSDTCKTQHWLSSVASVWLSDWPQPALCTLLPAWLAIPLAFCVFFERSKLFPASGPVRCCSPLAGPICLLTATTSEAPSPSSQSTPYIIPCHISYFSFFVTLICLFLCAHLTDLFVFPCLNTSSTRSGTLLTLSPQHLAEHLTHESVMCLFVE